MLLHTLAAAPSSAAFGSCLRVLKEHDALLLLGDGVYACRQVEASAQLLASGAQLYVLAPDAAAAGVAVVAGVESVDMDGFVALTERFERQLAWY